MDISNNKIIKVKLALSGMKNSDLAEKIGVDQSSLSRNESKIFADKVYQYFEKADPEINRAVEKMLGESALPIVEEPQSHYSRDEKYIDRLLGMIDEKSLIIQAQQTLIRSYERTLNEETEPRKKQTGS